MNVLISQCKHWHRARTRTWEVTIPNPNTEKHVGGCQNYGPFLGTLNIRCRIIIGIQKRDHNFDNHPCVLISRNNNGFGVGGSCIFFRTIKKTISWCRIPVDNHLKPFPVFRVQQQHCSVLGKIVLLSTHSIQKETLTPARRRGSKGGKPHFRRVFCMPVPAFVQGGGWA